MESVRLEDVTPRYIGAEQDREGRFRQSNDCPLWGAVENISSWQIVLRMSASALFGWSAYGVLGLEAVMDRDVVYGLSQHKTDQCNDVQVSKHLR